MEVATLATSFPLSYLVYFYSAVCSFFSRVFLRILRVGPIPKHIAIIMDGNRRYADRFRIDRTRGHRYGYDRLIDTLENCLQLGVKFVTVYAFSTDNFRRPADEVNALMNLMEEKLDRIYEKHRLTKDFGVRVQILGDLSLLPSNVQAAAERVMAATKHNNSSVLNICLAYTSTAEIVHAIQEIRDKFLARQHGIEHPCSQACPTGSDVGDENAVEKSKHNLGAAAPSAYHLVSAANEPCSGSKPTQLEARSKERADSALLGKLCSENSASCTEKRSLRRKNGRFSDETLELNAGKLGTEATGQEQRNGSIRESCCSDEQLLQEVIEESDHSENGKVSSLNLGFITIKEIDSHLYTAGCPPPDLLIRTSGETRLSNFMLWQCGSNSHLAFCKALWPEFSLRHLAWIILDYQRSFSELEKHRKLEDELQSHNGSLS